MGKVLKILLSIILIIVVIIAIYFANRYSYIDTVQISLKDGDSYFVVEAYRYDINKVRKYYMFTNTMIDKKVDIKFDCDVRVIINENDELCYDGGKYALYTKNIETLDDVKAAVKNKKTKVNKSKTKSKVIVMNKDFAEFLKSFE